MTNCWHFVNKFFAENFYHASFQKSLSDTEKKKIKKKKEKKQIIRGGIKTSE